MDDHLQLLFDEYTVHGSRAKPLLFPDMSHLELSLPEHHFVKRYRLDHDAFDVLHQELLPHLRPDVSFGRPRIPNVTRILATLRFLANPTMRQTAAGDSLGLSQATVSRILPEVAGAVCKLKPKYLRWPEEGEETWQVQQGFASMAPSRYPGTTGFPRVIGCIDCTHVPVRVAGVPERECYRDREGNLSLNVQAICNHECMFTNVVARWYGSVHDSRIFAMSKIGGEFARGMRTGILLGDQGYPCLPYLMTPFAFVNNAAEERYQFCHVQTRNCIERAFGLLKQVWQSTAGTIDLDVDTARTTTVACMVLHNFRRYHRQQQHDSLLTDSNSISTTTLPASVSSSSGTSTSAGTMARDAIVQQYFA